MWCKGKGSGCQVGDPGSVLLTSCVPLHHVCTHVLICRMGVVPSPQHRVVRRLELDHFY